jgi:hypothetical protein
MSIEPLQSASDFRVSLLNQLPQVRVSHAFYVFGESAVRSKDCHSHFVEVVQPDDLATLFGQLDFFLLCSCESIPLQAVGFGSGEHVWFCRDRV